MTDMRTYPHGVPSWIDTEQPDPEAGRAFYEQLFGWTFETVSAPGGPYYAVATKDGRDVAGLGSADGPPAVWNTYIAVEDADRTASELSAAGGTIVAAVTDIGEAGRLVIARDPAGATFRLWQAGRRLGAQIVNAPGTWNFSDLHTDDRETLPFYTGLFGWAVVDMGFATLVRRPGYGDHLEATVDPQIRARQAGVVAPPGFEDAIAWVASSEAGTVPHWHVTFAVADRDEAARRAAGLGAEVIDREDTQWTRTALMRDPQGAVFTASQFTPPE